MKKCEKMNPVKNTFFIAVCIVFCISLRHDLAVHCLLQSNHETKYEGRDFELLDEENNLCN